MLEIKYVYREPEDRPIEKAMFNAGGPCNVEITISPFISTTVHIAHEYEGRRVVAVYSKANFADFTALCIRINRQINGGNA